MRSSFLIIEKKGDYFFDPKTMLDKHAVRLQAEDSQMLAVITQHLNILDQVNATRLHSTNVNVFFKEALRRIHENTKSEIIEEALDLSDTPEEDKVPIYQMIKLLVDLRSQVCQEMDIRGSQYERIDFFTTYQECRANLQDYKEVLESVRVSIYQPSHAAHALVCNPVNMTTPHDIMTQEKQQLIQQLALYLLIKYIEKNLTESHLLSFITLLTLLRYCGTTEMPTPQINISQAMAVSFGLQFPFFEGFLNIQSSLLSKVSLSIQRLACSPGLDESLSLGQLKKSLHQICCWITRLQRLVDWSSLYPPDQSQGPLKSTLDHRYTSIEGDKVVDYLNKTLMSQIKRYDSVIDADIQKEAAQLTSSRCGWGSVLSCLFCYPKQAGDTSVVLKHVSPVKKRVTM